eukprot:9501427-Pyramimonas_sp.AAC.1
MGLVNRTFPIDRAFLTQRGTPMYWAYESGYRHDQSVPLLVGCAQGRSKPPRHAWTPPSKASGDRGP